MSTHVLSRASALNPGADLWIVAHLELSHWTAELDWYLNFQLCKASRHQSAKTMGFLNEVTQMTELDKFELPSLNNAPLMIPSEMLLPNKWVVVMPGTTNFESWIKDIFKVWSDLNRPSLRVFLPPGLSSGAFQQAWIQHISVQDFTVVLD
jgi:hypothetical protein